MQAELTSDPEIMELAEAIGTGPQMSNVVAEASLSAALEGNFSDRDPVLAQQTADNTLQVTPPTMGA